MIPLKDNLNCKVKPTATFIIIALNVIGFGIELLQGANIQNFMMHWCVVPANISHAFASGSVFAIAGAMLTVLTAMFLHGGWMHIIGNMVFLQAFGRSVEARMGSIKFALWYVIGGYAAWGLHMLTDPTSMVPALGASGAIAFVLGAYLVFYPKAEFKTLFMLAFIPILAIVKAWMLTLAWFIVQVWSGVGGLLSPAGGGGVAYWAHIGGFLAGVIIAGVFATLHPADPCYNDLSCGCDCKNKGNGHCCKKHRFQVINPIRFFARTAA